MACAGYSGKLTSVGPPLGREDSLNIRKAAVQDAQRFAEIHVAAWRAAYPGVVPHETLENLSIGRRAERFREFLGSSDLAPTFVIEDAGAVVGFMTAGACRDEDCDRQVGEVWGIYLDPPCWRRGLGTAALAVAEDMLARDGCTRSVLWVFAANEAARGFYEANGYRPDGHTKRIELGSAILAVRLAKRLRCS